MVQLRRSIFNEMLGTFNSFKILNSVGNSLELYAGELNKKGPSYKRRRDAGYY